MTIALLVAAVIIVILVSGVKIVQPYEQGIYMRLGKYVRVLNQGLNIVFPLINEVIKLDLRTEVLDVPRQEVITKDNSPVNVDAVIYIRVTDPKKAYFEVTQYKIATVNLAQTTLRAVIGEMELDEVLSSRERINIHLRDTLDESTDKWGVRVEAVEIREVDPAAKVKNSMEEQTSAERLRRAAILKAEGEKKARILEAEGRRQAMVLEAEGKRVATILEGQGESQRLRILSVGAATMDSKALSVLSMDTMVKVGQGESSKIFFPMEVTKLINGISDYVGTASDSPDREISTAEDIRTIFENPEDMLGNIPKPEDIQAEAERIDALMDKELKESTQMMGSKTNAKNES
jgi:regulator of protease activity HflC (stomatin/prohibitin superfamily)